MQRRFGVDGETKEEFSKDLLYLQALCVILSTCKLYFYFHYMSSRKDSC